MSHKALSGLIHIVFLIILPIIILCIYAPSNLSAVLGITTISLFWLQGYLIVLLHRPYEGLYLIIPCAGIATLMSFINDYNHDWKTNIFITLWLASFLIFLASGINLKYLYLCLTPIFAILWWIIFQAPPHLQEGFWVGGILPTVFFSLISYLWKMKTNTR